MTRKYKIFTNKANHTEKLSLAGIIMDVYIATVERKYHSGEPEFTIGF
jgi:hypothetical protein